MTLYVVMVALPLVYYFLKRNLLNALLIWFFLVIFKEMGRIHVPMFPDLSPERIVWLFIFGIFLLQVTFRERKLVGGITSIEFMMFFFCIYVLFSMAIADTIYIEGHGLFLSGFLTGYVIPFSIFVLSKNIVDSEEAMKKVFVFFSVIGVYLGLTGVFEYFNIRALVFPKYIMNPFIGVHAHFGRARGPFLNASVNAIVLAQALFMSFYLYMQRYEKWSKLLLVAMMIMMVGFFLTFNRSSWLAMVIAGMLITIAFRQTKRIIVLFIIMGTLIISVNQLGNLGTSRITAGERLSDVNTIYIRLNMYNTALNMFLDNPIFGVGYHKYKEASIPYFEPVKGLPDRGEGLILHNTMFLIIVELGLAGFIMFIFIYAQILKASIKLYRYLPAVGFLSKGFVVIFWAMSLFLLIRVQTSNITLLMFPISIYFLMAGIIVGMEKRISFGENVFASQ